jgi:hypothetical protein
VSSTPGTWRRTGSREFGSKKVVVVLPRGEVVVCVLLTVSV